MTKAKIKDQGDLLNQGDAVPDAEAKTTATEGQGSRRARTGSSTLPTAAKAKGADVVKFEPPKSVLRIIAEAAANPAIDVAKMQALIEIQRDTEAKEQFHAAMLAVDAELPVINKDGKIEMRGGKAIRFASFENLNRIIKPILRAHGLRLTFQPDAHPSGQGLVVHCHLTKGLYRESCTVPVPTGAASPAMNAQQAVGNAISYAKRYGAIALLNLETEAKEDRDTDGAVAAEKETIDGSQAKELLKAIDDCGITAAQFIKKYKVTAVQLLPLRLFDEAIKACRDYKARAQAASKQ